MGKLLPEQDISQEEYITAIQQPNFKAASVSYRDAQREAIIGDADALAINEYLFIQGRCRYLVRNDAVASSARNRAVKSVGNLRVKWQVADGSIHEEMQGLWDEFIDNPMLDGHGDLDCYQALRRGERFEVGEDITRIITYKSNAKIPLKLQGISSEYLDIYYRGKTGNDDYTRYGITFDQQYNVIPEIYNFLPEQYYGIPNYQVNQFERIPVSANDILHVFERKWQGQWRGLPALTASLISLYQLEDLAEATVRTQTSASLISWVVDELPNALNKTPLGTVKIVGQSNPTDVTQKLTFSNQGGTVQYVEGGGKFQMVQSRDLGTGLVDLYKHEFQKIASALDMPYYQLTGDTSSLDFSTIRALLIEQRQTVEQVFNIVEIPYFMAPLCKRFKDYAVTLGFKVKDAIPIYEFPRWYGVDDLKDFQAYLLAVASGMMPIQSVWQLLGYDENQIKKSMEVIKELGLEHILKKQDKPEQNNEAPTQQNTSN